MYFSPRECQSLVSSGGFCIDKESYLYNLFFVPRGFWPPELIKITDKLEQTSPITLVDSIKKDPLWAKRSQRSRGFDFSMELMWRNMFFLRCGGEMFVNCPCCGEYSVKEFVWVKDLSSIDNLKLL